jgi:hypothetical protein
MLPLFVAISVVFIYASSGTAVFVMLPLAGTIACCGDTCDWDIWNTHVGG